MGSTSHVRSHSNSALDDFKNAHKSQVLKPDVSEILSGRKDRYKTDAPPSNSGTGMPGLQTSVKKAMHSRRQNMSMDYISGVA